MIIAQKLREAKNPYFFSAFVNVRSALKGSNIRCKQLHDKEVFQVSSKGEIRLASVNSRVLSYLDGFDARAEYVGRTYQVDSIKFSAGDLVIDCGANMGDLEYYLRKFAPSVNYIGFEPNPHDFVCLENNVGPLKCKNIGLWNLEDSIPFYVNDAHASSSFIEPPEYTDIIRIPASTLSVQFPVEKIRLLKLEAEGAEPEVLQGAVPILSNIDYISADVGPERGIEEEETRDFVVDFLTAFGFELINESRGHRKIVLFKRLGVA